mgnify:CR=1 FL=1
MSTPCDCSLTLVQRAVMDKIGTHEDFRSLICDMMARDPADRPDCNTIQRRVDEIEKLTLDVTLPQDTDSPSNWDAEQSLPYVPSSVLGTFRSIYNLIAQC